MSAQIQLHVRVDGMHDEMLQSEGVVDGAFGSLMGQLTKGHDYMDEFNDLLQDADSVVVGGSEHTWARKVSGLIDGPTEVDDVLVKQLEVIVESFEGADPKVLEWVTDHRGEEIFSIHW